MGVFSRISGSPLRLFQAILLLTAPVFVVSNAMFSGGQTAEKTELNSQETTPTFKLQAERNVVLVRVVVRDGHGHGVSDLHKEDFQVFDRGKPQAVSHFAVEVPSARLEQAVSPVSPEQEVDLEAMPETSLAASTPQRYLALYFDDAHLSQEDLVRTRDAADRYLASNLQPGDRVGIFTSSGQGVLDFTDDLAQLHDKLFGLHPRAVVAGHGDRGRNCPDISDYQAYLMVERHDPFAIDIATQESYQCSYENANVPPETGLARARVQAEGEAVRVMNEFETETEYVLRGLEMLIRRMTATRGQRSIVLVSPGFLTVTQLTRLDDVIDRALRSSIVISTLDAKGLHAPVPFGGAEKQSIVVASRPDLMGRKGMLEIDRLAEVSQVLSALATDTGGEFFTNNNNLDEGFRKVGALPEVYYVLGFSPQNLKLDGSFHPLKVKLVKPGSFKLQARRGYYAPRKPADQVAQAKEEIEQAVFSHDELNELPIEVHTQFFKITDPDAKLSVLTHLDLRFLRFRKEEGRNLNVLTFVTVLFDRDGKYVAAKEKHLELRLRDTSLENLLKNGITVRTSFELKPGTYLVRQVVRDAEGAQLSGLNRTVEIPY